MLHSDWGQSTPPQYFWNTRAKILNPKSFYSLRISSIFCKIMPLQRNFGQVFPTQYLSDTSFLYFVPAIVLYVGSRSKTLLRRWAWVLWGKDSIPGVATNSRAAHYKKPGATRQFVTCSKAYPSPRTCPSCQAPPIKESPIGKLWTRPIGTVKLGYPAIAAA